VTARFSDALAALLIAGILTCWAPGFWPVALIQTGAFAMTAAWIARAMITRNRVHSTWALLATAAVALWAAAQLASHGTVYSFETGKAVLYWSANAAVFFVAMQICVSPQMRNRFLHALLWFGFVLSLVVVLQYFTSGGKVFWIFPTGYARTLGPFLYKNQCAAFLELVFPLAVYRSLVDRRHTLLYTSIAATMFATVIAAVSRAGAVLVSCELIAILLLAWIWKLIPMREFGRKLAATAALCLTLTAVVGWRITWERFNQPEPFGVRRELLLSSLSMIRERPWTGFGMGTWAAAYPAYARFDNGLTANHAHNDWAEWTVEGGLPVLGLLGMLAVWSLPRTAQSLWSIGIPAVFAHSLVDYPLREPALAAVLFAMLGALGALTAQEAYSTDI
jgi:O-antigen ligase